MKVKRFLNAYYQLVKIAIKIQNIKINTGLINYKIAENPLPSFSFNKDKRYVLLLTSCEKCEGEIGNRDNDVILMDHRL